MAKGIIQGFLGGASQGMADAGKMMFANTLKKESDEANDLRARTLNSGNQAWKSKENQKDRDSNEGIADTKATADAAKDGSTTNMKNAASLRAKGYPSEVADAVAQGAMKQIKDEETGDMILINTLTNKPVGRLTSGGTTGDKEWIPEGGQTENAPISKKNRDDAANTADNKAGWLSGDAVDFPETGSEKAFAKKEAQRLANEERGPAKNGIVNGVAEPSGNTVDIDRTTANVPMPAPKKATPYREGQKTVADYRAAFPNMPKAELEKRIKKYLAEGKLVK